MHSTWNITRSPLVFNQEQADDVEQKMGGLDSAARALVRGTAGSSPYLAGLLVREAEFALAAFDQDPSDALSGVLENVGCLSPDELGPGLRRAKRQVALLCGLADLGGVWSLEQVTGALTDLADLAVDRALKVAVENEIRRGKLPGATQADADRIAGGVAVLAMGKMGARELNYSSDIDLICLFDETKYDPDDFFEVRKSLIRATKSMSQTLNEATGEGYVFRTDLRLRPDPSVTPVCLAMESAERYYESFGRTWERAAFIKARVCAGDFDAGNAFLKRLTPFVWRKHLDFAAIEDAHDMRLRIREHKGTGRSFALEGHNVKLGLGGIREIEFFTQTRQIISGGRDAALRLRETVPSLLALADAGWVTQQTADTLIADYRAHRDVEHRLQMVADAQTHTLPSSADGFKRLSCLMGRDDVDALRTELQDRFHRVHEETERFFQSDTADTSEIPEPHQERLDRWMRLPALRTSRAQESFARLSPTIFKALDGAEYGSDALASFEGFLSGLPAGVQLFALFEANPQLVELIVDIAGTAPTLADYLGRNSAVLDAVIGGEFFADWPGQDRLCDALEKILRAAPDYEAKLDAARRFRKEWHFRIGVHHLRGLADAETVGRQYSDLAAAILTGLWPVVRDEFARKHGPPPGRGACVFGMGSLGAGVLNAESDLDLIVIYDADGVESSDGKRPLESRTYYARLTQALITGLSAPMQHGRLYEVDMRLRPSGRKGTVATALNAFRDYQRTQAWGWEHLALTRARPMAGSAEVGAEVEEFRSVLMGEISAKGNLLSDVGDMLLRLEDAHPRKSTWDLKAGRGGLKELELVAQAATLDTCSLQTGLTDQIDQIRSAGWITDEEHSTLRAAKDLMWRVVAAERLLSPQDFDVETLGDGGRAFLVAGTSHKGIDALEKALDRSFKAVGEIVDRLCHLERSG